MSNSESEDGFYLREDVPEYANDLPPYVKSVSLDTNPNSQPDVRVVLKDGTVVEIQEMNDGGQHIVDVNGHSFYGHLPRNAYGEEDYGAKIVSLRDIVRIVYESVAN